MEERAIPDLDIWLDRSVRGAEHKVMFLKVGVFSLTQGYRTSHEQTMLIYDVNKCFVWLYFLGIWLLDFFFFFLLLIFSLYCFHLVIQTAFRPYEEL